jgi:hypothetical protein
MAKGPLQALSARGQLSQCSSRRDGDAGRNCLNIKGIIAIKLEAAPRYQLRRFTPECDTCSRLPTLPERRSVARECRLSADLSNSPRLALPFIVPEAIRTYRPRLDRSSQ